VLSESQAGLLDRALALRNRSVATEMTPWRRAVTIPADSTGPARQRRLANVRTQEFVIVTDNAGQSIGAADPLALLLEPNKPASALMADIVMMDATTSVPKALRMLRTAGATTAVVIEPRTKRAIGIVTVHDLFEPLTGGPIRR
jgi:CBS domain containing-hemolysin-like protein